LVKFDQVSYKFIYSSASFCTEHLYFTWLDDAGRIDASSPVSHAADGLLVFTLVNHLRGVILGGSNMMQHAHRRKSDKIR